MASSAFLDTTVVTDLLLKTGAAQTAAQLAIDGKDALVPQYALKEFKAGPLQHYRWLFDKLRQERSLAAALTALQKLSRTPQRAKTSTALEALALIAGFFGQFSLDKIQTKYGDGHSADVVIAEMLRLEIKRRVLNAWKKRGSLGARFDVLECYPETELISADDRLELKPNQCENSGCAVQRLIAERPDEIDRVIEALALLPDKAENLNRRRVLKEIRKRPTRSITPQQCRAIGDAYFALRCPNDAILVTTNTKDIEPLAAALGKTVQRP